MVEAVVTAMVAAMAAAALAVVWVVTKVVAKVVAKVGAKVVVVWVVAKAVAPKAAGVVQMADRNNQAHEAEVKAMVEVAMVEEATAVVTTVAREGALRGVAVGRCGGGYRSQGRTRPPTARASPWSPVHRSHPH